MLMVEVFMLQPIFLELLLFSNNYYDSNSPQNNRIPILTDRKVEGKRSIVFHATSGAVKRVWFLVKNRTFVHPDPTTKWVYYTPVFSFFGKNKKELEEEVETMKKIDGHLKEVGGSTRNLAVRAREYKNLISKKYTVKVRRASGGDFEKKIRDIKTSLNQRIKFGLNLLSGFKNLHQANFVYGDPKPENCLIYNNRSNNDRENLKIADFGKAKKVESDRVLSYKGNTRFAPPEGTLSKSGDVYGAALILIRNFEEEIFKNEKDNSKTSLYTVPNQDFDAKASDKLRGVERFVVEHKAFLAGNPGVSLSSLMKRKKMGKLTDIEMKAQQTAMHDYITLLQFRLENTNLKSKAKGLCDLLKDMTKANLKSENSFRIDIQEALQRYRDWEKLPSHIK